MKRADVVFVQGKSLISRVIRKIDKGEFSHCAIAISDSKVVEADYDTRVAVRNFNRSKYNKVEVIDLKLNKVARMDAYNAVLSHIGKRYDYISLIWYVMKSLFNVKGKNRLNNPNNLICSELVFIVLDEIGFLDDMNIKYSTGIDLTPNELYDLVKYATIKKRV